MARILIAEDEKMIRDSLAETLMAGSAVLITKPWLSVLVVFFGQRKRVIDTNMVDRRACDADPLTVAQREWWVLDVGDEDIVKGRSIWLPSHPIAFLFLLLRLRHHLDYHQRCHDD